MANFYSKFYILIVLLVILSNRNIFCIGLIGNEIKLGFVLESIGDIEYGDFKIISEVWTKEMLNETKSGYEFKSEVFKNSSHLIDYLEIDDLDVLITTTSEYFKNNLEDKFSPSLYGKNRKGKGQSYILIVNREKENTQEYLKTVWVENLFNSFISKRIIEKYFKKNNVDMDIKVFGKENKFSIIYKYIRGEIGTLFLSRETFEIMSELNPRIENISSIKFESEKYIHLIGFKNRKMNREKEDLMMKVGLNIKGFDNGSKILEIYKLDNIESVNLRDIENVRLLWSD